MFSAKRNTDISQNVHSENSVFDLGFGFLDWRFEFCRLGLSILGVVNSLFTDSNPGATNDMSNAFLHGCSGGGGGGFCIIG